MNTAFQCLLHNRAFMRALHIYDAVDAVESPNLVSCFKDIKNNQRAMIERCITDLGKLFDFREENDMQEFYLACVNKMCEQVGKPCVDHKIAEYENVIATASSKAERFYASLDLCWYKDNKKEYSTLVPIFNGQVVVQTKCSKCGYLCHNVEGFMTLDLDMIHDNSKKTLEDMICKYFSPEHLTVWKCDRCNESDATKMQQISRLPRTLTISLKRFIGKHEPVDIPEIITLPDSAHVMSHPCSYKLFAIGCHQGDQTGGHYYAICKEGPDKWNMINDRRVTPMTNLLTEDAYMLFYEWTSI